MIALWLLAAAAGNAYYVDADRGDDRAAGLTPATAWRTLAKVNATAFQPGDRILLRAGCAWDGTLAPQGSGTPGHPIMLDRYGDRGKPRIRGNGGEAALLLHNQEYWEIANLDLSNDATDEGLRRGVLVRGSNLGGVLHHIYLRDLDVHDVRGKLGADTVSKTTGGIAFEVRGTGKPTRFDDVLVEDSSIRHVDNTGLYLWSDYSPHPRDPQWAALQNTRVRIRRNRLADIGKNAMGIRASLAPVVEYNLVANAAARLHGNAIYVFGCKDALLQYNDVSGTRMPGLEGAAFDSDYNSEGTVIQYNYSHENEGGLVDFCNNPKSPPPRGYNDGTIVRYNVSRDDVYRVFGFDGNVTNTLILNNTVYVGKSVKPHIVEFDLFGKAPGFADRTWFRGNLIHNEGGGSYEWGQATNWTFEGNCFTGNRPPSQPHDMKPAAACAGAGWEPPVAIQ